MGVSGSDTPCLMTYQFYLFSKADKKSESTVRTSPRLGSSFLDNPGWNSRWFHRPGAGLLGSSSLALDPGQTFGDYQSGSSPDRACSHRAAKVHGGFLSPSGCWLGCGL